MKIACRVQSLTSSPTLAITSKAKQLKKSGVDVVSFGAGEPDFDTPVHIKKSAIKAINEGFTKYTPSAGMPQLKQAIVEKLKRDNNLQYDPSQIVVSNGAKHSLYSILQTICDKGDEVIIPVPYWVSYPEMVKVAQGKAVFILGEEKNKFKITAKQFEKAIKKKTRALIINSPANPTGCVYTKEELKQIADIAANYGICVISDEIYEKLVYDKAEHVSIASLNEKMLSLTFTVNGLSKAYSMTGWRIGYLAGPKDAVLKISNLQDHSTSCPNSIAQAAAVTALTSSDECIDKMKKEFVKRRNYIVDRINAIKGLSVIKPEGAFYVFCNISKTGLNSLEFAQRLLDEAQVAVIPGIGFGDDHYIRLSFATSTEQIEKGLDRISKWVKLI
ncbi:MAG: pyridoxal phosphate-dependent aminotransferase [Candidatus Omnitrophica bacterium]|nr:pyridoxal phosphate-dependent aminotransferase [Candidatus Omnitrophota bacterium]